MSNTIAEKPVRFLDVGCGHDVRFREKLEYGLCIQEYCMVCARDRGSQRQTEYLQQLGAYLALRKYMDIDDEPGTLLVMWFPFNGWPHDQQALAKAGLKLGDVVTLASAVIHASATDVYLVEHPGLRFNTVNFGYATPADLLSVRAECIEKKQKPDGTTYYVRKQS